MAVGVTGDVTVGRSFSHRTNTSGRIGSIVAPPNTTRGGKIFGDVARLILGELRNEEPRPPGWCRDRPATVDR